MRLVCQYLGWTPDLLAALFASKDPTLFAALVWGLYQEGCLTTAFLLDASGTAWGEDGFNCNALLYSEPSPSGGCGSTLITTYLLLCCLNI